MVGLDDYCLDFRAGYFERQNPAAMPGQNAAAPVPPAEMSRRVAPLTGFTHARRGFIIK